MKLDLSEILLVLIIIGVILLVFRGRPAPRNATPPPVNVRRPSTAEIEEARIKSNRQNRLRWLGSVFIVIGLFVLACTFKVFDYLLMRSAGAALIILLGIVILFLSTRR